MIGQSPEARPTTHIYKSGAVWDTTFLEVVRANFGIIAWDEAFAAARAEYSISAEQAQKKYAVIWRTTDSMLSKSINCEPLESLWQAITSFFDIEPSLPKSTRDYCSQTADK
jgi:predicted lipoprotein